MAPRSAVNFWIKLKFEKVTNLLDKGMASDAIAHINAEAAFSPPPQSRKIDESQTNFNENN